MKNQRQKLFTFLSLILIVITSFFFLATNNANANAVDDFKNKLITAKYGVNWMKMDEFKAVNPSIKSFFGNTKDKKEWDAWWNKDADPHYPIDIIKESDAKTKVSDMIIGLGIEKLGAVKAALVSVQAVDWHYTDRINFTADEVKTIKESKKDYIIIKGNYTDLSTTNFIAGIGVSDVNIKQSKILAETKEHYKKSLTFINDKFALITEAEKANLLKNAPFASGACFTRKALKVEDECSNVIASSCKTSSTVFFLYGVSCENINDLLSKTNKAKIIASKENSNTTTESTTVAAKRDEIEIQFQVPFGGVKHGIDLATYINEIYKYLIGFALVLTGIMFTLGGFEYMTGKKIGEKDHKRNAGLSTMKNAALGLILLVSSYTVLQIINPNALDLKQLKVTEIERDSFDMDIGTIGGPNEKHNSGYSYSSSVNPKANKLPGCAAYLPPVASSDGLTKKDPWTLKCIDIITDTTRITDASKMLEYTLQYHNDTNNANEHLVYYIASSGMTRGYLFQSDPKFSWGIVVKHYKEYVTLKTDARKTYKNNDVFGQKNFGKDKDTKKWIKTHTGGVCIASKPFTLSSNAIQKAWPKDSNGFPTGTDCTYQDMITSSYKTVYKQEDDSYSFSKANSKGKSTGYIYRLPEYKQKCRTNLSAKASYQRLCVSCIGFILNYYACIGRPVFFNSATGLINKGQIITEIKTVGNDVYMNGKLLKIGDVLGWPSGTYSESANVKTLDAIATKLQTTRENSGSASSIFKNAKRKENGVMKSRNILVVYVGHVILYIGDGKTLDWGNGTVRSLAGWYNNITHVVFLNDMETSMYNKIMKNDNYKYKTCKSIYDKLKEDSDAYFKTPNASKKYQSIPLLGPGDIYKRPPKK